MVLTFLQDGVKVSTSEKLVFMSLWLDMGTGGLSMATLGERLKKLLAKKNMTQHELAERVDCTEASISHYIKGDRIPRAGVLSKIAIALDTTSEYLNEGVPTDAREELLYAKKLIARNASKMTTADKRDFLSILMGADDE